MSFTYEEKLEALRRELKLRRMVYPRRVKNGSMKRTEAERQIAIVIEMIDDYERWSRTEQLPLGEK